MFDEHLCLFGGEFPTAGLTVKTDFAVKTYLFAATLWAAYILIFWLKHFPIRPPSYPETLLISSKCFIGEI